MHGQSSSPWTPALIEMLRELWDTGISTIDIGRILGVSKNAVIGKANRLDLDPRPSPIRAPLTEEEKNEIVIMLRNGMHATAIKLIKRRDYKTIAAIRDETPTPIGQTLPELPSMPVPDQLNLPLDPVVIPFPGRVQRRCQMPQWADGERTRFVNGEPDFCGRPVVRGPYCAECANRAYTRRCDAEAVA